jgi:hypothetical protein
LLLQRRQRGEAIDLARDGFGHAVEGLREFRRYVTALHRDAFFEVTIGKALGCCCGRHDGFD